MALKSNLFAGDRALEACAVSASAHLTIGASGPHVGKVQAALLHLDGLKIDGAEVESGRYGPSTAAAVLAYKKARRIVNRAYQSQEDAIVGVMTIASLDGDLRKGEVRPALSGESACDRGFPGVGPGERRVALAATARRAGVRTG